MKELTDFQVMAGDYGEVILTWRLGGDPVYLHVAPDGRMERVTTGPVKSPVRTHVLDLVPGPSRKARGKREASGNSDLAPPA